MSRTPQQEIEYSKQKAGGRIKDEFRQRQMLNIPETIKLGNLISATYVDKRLLDLDYAKWAAEELKFPVSVSNVTGVRKGLGIESTHNRVAREAGEERAARKAAREAEKARPAAPAPAMPAAEPSAAQALLAGVLRLHSDWKLFEQRAIELRAGTSARIDGFEARLLAYERRIESAERGALAAREKCEALERKMHALQETFRIELEKIQGRMRVLTTAAGSVLTGAHPNGHAR